MGTNKNTRSPVFCGKKTTIADPNNVCGEGRFAPIRPDDKAKFYVNGKDYMKEVHDHIKDLSKGSKMYIADWGMDLGTHLIRNNTSVDKKSRLVDVLAAAAMNDVQIRVLLYDSALAVFNTKDVETEAVLESFLGHSKEFSSHIRVSRHRPSIFFSHHQKFVVTVDHKKKTVVAFLGGLDLMWGRWDTVEHPLIDENTNVDQQIFIGDDYANPTLYDGKAITVNRKDNPRMPWHDVHMRVEGNAARDVERNFIERWNFQTTAGLPATIASEKIKEYLPKYIPSLQRQKNPHYKKNEPEYISDDSGDDIPNPKYDEYESHEEQNQRIIKYLKYRPKDVSVDDTGDKSAIHEKKVELSNFTIGKIGKQSIQIIRSINKSTGGKRLEAHIQEAMISAIRGAQNYIYIETQYLVGSYSSPTAKNTICEEIVKRILRAFNDPKKPKFRVYIVFPVNPDGHLGDESNKEFMFWQWITIHRIRKKSRLDEKGWGGMIADLIKGMGLSKEKDPFIKISEYFNIFNLRNHGYGKLNGKYVTEQIYIHAKMMIVDDRIAIIGTANVNDRSLIGDKDSEIAAIIFDREEVSGKMNGKAVKVRKFAKELRMQLWSEHIWGDMDHLTSSEIDDPVADSTHNLILGRANSNTEAFEKAFPGIPSDKYATISAQMDAMKTRSQDSATATEIGNIIGYLVKFPFNWLREEKTIKDSFRPNALYGQNQVPKAQDSAIV